MWFSWSTSVKYHNGISLNLIFLGNLQLDADDVPVLLAHGAGQLQQRLAQLLLGVHPHQNSHNLLLLHNAHRQVAHEPLRQRVAAQARKN
jgi:hypothetical protein